jgi:hypothetical protein
VVGSCCKGGHEFAGMTRRATKAATTEPIEKKIESDVKRWRLLRGRVSSANVPSVGIDPCRGLSAGVSTRFQGAMYLLQQRFREGN